MEADEEGGRRKVAQRRGVEVEVQGAFVARANCLGVDRPGLQFAAKEAYRGIAGPVEADLGRVKRIAPHDTQTVPVVVIATWLKSEGKNAICGALTVGGMAVNTW